MDPDDTVDVIVLKTPVWEFKFGDLLGLFDIYHDAVGFSSHKTGKNFTTEWYELFQLFNCTFPHILPGQDEPLWCNQGAACLYDGIDDTHWTKYGVLKKIAEISGDQFNQLMDWIHSDNNTGLYYQTFRIMSSTDPQTAKEWFRPYDCANYPMRLFQQIASMGVKFEDYLPNYTFFSLIADEPQKLGNASAIFGSGGNASLAAEMRSFYTDFQSHQSFLHFLIHFVEAGFDIFEEGRFYYYFNSEYWFVPIKKPFIHITYEPIPLPAPKEH
jgi:ceroid-lipofuscinosis neuronal protein 5